MKIDKNIIDLLIVINNIIINIDSDVLLLPNNDILYKSDCKIAIQRTLVGKSIKEDSVILNKLLIWYISETAKTAY